MFLKLHQQTVYAVTIFTLLFAGAFFMANVELPAWSHYLSAASTIAFSLPCFWAVRWWLGWSDGAKLIAVLASFAVVTEAIAAATGFPYGHFGYSDLLGYRILGL